MGKEERNNPLESLWDSELIVHQIRGLNVAKNDTLKSYRNRVWNMLEDFDAFNLVSIPRN